MNINIVGRPFTAEDYYYNGGIQDVVNVRNNIFTSPYSIATNLDSAWNQLVWSLNSEILGSAQMAELYIDLTGNPAITEIQIFNEILTESATASLGFNEFYNNTFSISDRVDSIVNIINTNINLNWRYTAINVSGTFVRINAINTGSQYSLIAPNFSMTPSLVSGSTLGQDGSRGEKLQNYNYKCFVEIWEVENIDWNRTGSVNLLSGQRRTKITTLNQSWNPDNLFTFDISNLFEIPTDINDLPIGQFTLTYRPKTYYLRYGESFIGGYDPATDLPTDLDPWDITNTNETKRFIGETELRWLSGGVFEQSVLINSYPRYWLNSQTNTTSSSVNDYLEIKPAQNFTKRLKRREYNQDYMSVWFWNDQQYNSVFDLRLRTDFTFVDGTSGSQNTFLTTGLSVGGLYTIDASLTNLGFDSIESFFNNRILFYTNTIEVNRGIGWTVLSTSLEYEIDLNDEKDSTRTNIWWINTFGALEQFSFEGFKQTKLNTKFNTYTKSLLNVDFVERKRHITGIISKQPSKVYTVNSGWMSRDEMEFLTSILKSNKAWWKEPLSVSVYFNEIQNQDSQVYSSINILDSNWLIDNKGQLYNLELTIESAQNENVIK
jgi:hypothetical protein